MRQALITYDRFCETVQKMQANGEKTSVRTILSHTGGSFTKISSFLKRWREEQAHAQSHVDRELSPNLKQAILAEIGKAVAGTQALYEAQLTQLSDQLDEAHEALARQKQLQAEYEQRITDLNQQLAVLNQLQTQQVERIESLEKRLEQSLELQHQADKRAAVSETRCAELEKQLAKEEEAKRLDKTKG